VFALVRVRAMNPAKKIAYKVIDRRYPAPEPPVEVPPPRIPPPDPSVPPTPEQNRNHSAGGARNSAAKSAQHVVPGNDRERR